MVDIKKGIRVSTLLSIASGIGLVASVVSAVGATVNSMRIVEKEREFKYDKENDNYCQKQLSNIDIIKLTWKEYIPTLAFSAITLACIGYSNAINIRTQKELAGAYLMLGKTFNEYRKRNIELSGKEVDESIMEYLSAEQSEPMDIHHSYYFSECNLIPKDIDDDIQLFYIESADRYFTSSLSRVINAEYHLNHNFIAAGYATLNDFYNFLGISKENNGDEIGWSITDDDPYWIYFNHKKEMVNNIPCVVIEMKSKPINEFEYSDVMV